MTFSILPTSAVAEPTFQETRNWIMSKFESYSEGIKKYNGVYYVSWNTPESRGNYIELGECSMKSILTTYEHIPDKTKTTYILEFKYSQISNSFAGTNTELSVRKDVRNLGPLFWIPLNSSMAKDVIYMYSRHRTKAFAYFNYFGGEADLLPRLESAFLHLKKLASKNPKCSPRNETF